jgi:hypothetical protein
MSKQTGICALCGKECDLTFEHIPPRSAFNSQPAKMYSGEKILFDQDRLPWDVQGLKYVPRQKGSGRYSLCEECNNNTGAWYGNTYRDFAYVIAEALAQRTKEDIKGITVEGIYGARLIKQIISMFCSVNNLEFLAGYLNPHQSDDAQPHSPLFQTLENVKMALCNAVFLIEELRAFVLNKDAKGLDKSKFKICMYATDSKMLKTNGLSSVMNFSENSFIILSEITVPPLGFILYINPPSDLKHTGIDITTLADLAYDEKADIQFPFEVLEMNTILPNDYRSREQIENDVNNTKKWCEENEDK